MSTETNEASGTNRNESCRSAHSAVRRDRFRSGDGTAWKFRIRGLCSAGRQDYNQSLVVQPDGYLVLRGAGTVMAEGLTLPQLQRAVAEAYRGVLRQPEITVALKDFDKPYFLASGEVVRPGKYELRGDLTVTEAVAIAGGFTQQARHSQVVLFRRVSANVAESHVIDLKRMLDSRNLREDLHLQPGDFIFVPQSRISKIRRYVPTNSMSWYMNPLQF